MSAEKQIKTPEVSFTLSGDRLTLRDEAGGGEVLVELDGEPSLTQATTSWFDVPMDGAVSFEVESLHFHNNTYAVVRDADGTNHGLITEDEFEMVANGTYVDFSATMKVLVYIERGTVTGRLQGNENSPDATRLEFDEPTRVVVGARSYQEEPLATMTVPDEPAALMTAVSHFGSGIKEWSAERSWATLRGHPPAIEVGEDLHIPDRLSTPETGVTVELPCDVASVFRAAPLAYYLGAELVPGDQPTLSIPGYTEPLGRGQELEQSVDELLARCLILDSLVRVGGYYSNDRYEYDQLAPELPFYPPELYDEPTHKQLLEYLEVPFELLEPFVPRWRATGVVRPRVEDVEVLPHLVNRLSRIRVTSDGQPRSPVSGPSLDHGATLSTAPAVPSRVGSVPVAGHKRTADWRRTPTTDASVLFIDETADDRRGYPTLDWDRFNIGEGKPTAEYRPTVTRAELASAFRANHVYLHYGNTVSYEGFVCSDGVLGFDDLPEANLGAVSLGWGNEPHVPPADFFRSGTVACLHRYPLNLPAAEAFATHLTLGTTVGLSAYLTGILNQTRFLGDISISLAERPSGQQPEILQATPTADDDYSVSVYAPVLHYDMLGRVIVGHADEGHGKAQIAGTPLELTQPVSAAKLDEYAQDGAIIRYERDKAHPEGDTRSSASDNS